MRPSYKLPYFYVNNVTTKNDHVTTDSTKPITGAQNPERTAKNRFGNSSKVRMEIRYGKDDKVFVLDRVYIDYLKDTFILVDNTFTQKEIGQ